MTTMMTATTMTARCGFSPDGRRSHQCRCRSVPNEIIARALSEADLALLAAQGFKQVERRALSGGDSLHRLRNPERLTLEAARTVVRAGAATADFNHHYRTEQGAAAGVPCSGGLCLVRQVIGWPPAATCGGLPRIGMVDTGVNAAHATFAEARLRLHSLDPAAARDQGTASDAAHGTALVALLVGDPASRSPGLVPGAELVAVDAFVRIRGDQRSDAFALITALDWLAGQDVQLINLSLAGPPSDALARQIEALVARDILIIAAAGNAGPRAAPAYPGAYDDVLAVTVVDRRKQVYRRAGGGPHVDLSAPGVDVWTAASVEGARTRTGTSYAAPFVTAAALWLRTESDLSPAELTRRLTTGTDVPGAAGRDPVFGADLLAPRPAGPRAGMVPTSPPPCPRHLDPNDQRSLRNAAAVTGNTISSAWSRLVLVRMGGGSWTALERRNGQA
ncbi:S8 family serine peptidase [Paracoccus sp. (in: a-proteobacteria)]|uniref:S8 family serine peptidase n=1 Tax=Paracoccus sp. TaxID=267 RepID=UPI00396C9BA8